MLNITPTLIADLRQLAETHSLTRADHEWLVAAVVGSLRPNRDKPVWELCRYVSGMAQDLDIDEVISSLLGSLSEGPASARARRMSAFGDFLLTREDCGHFAEVREVLGALRAQPDEAHFADAVRVLSAQLRQFRREALPLESNEAMFSDLLTELRRLQGSIEGISDATIFALWQHRLESGGPVEYRTCVDHVLIFQQSLKVLKQTSALSDAGEILDFGLTHAEIEMSGEKAAIEDLPASPKVLTDVERDLLATLTRLEILVAANLRSIYRYISFGEVQSGISNFLRRGGGGASIEARMDCAGALAYADLVKKLSGLRKSLENVLSYIAPALVRASQGEPVPQPLPSVARPRRAGFEGNVQEVAQVLAPHVDAMVHAFDLLTNCTSENRVPLQHFEDDRQAFSREFKRIYGKAETAGSNLP